jgi:hypothetical protein
MNTDRFWQIIEATHAATQDEQLEGFRRELQRWSAQELIEFERLFIEREFAAYNWDLWLVAWLCQGGRCSGDNFMDFRTWLISRGRAIYEAALQDADSLADELHQTEDPEFELFGYVPSKMEDQEFAAMERRIPRVWDLCVQRGIITTDAQVASSTLPAPEEVAKTVAPNLAETDFASHLKALQDAARQAYKPKD